jgi:DNA polymerase III alpha subunit
MNETTLQRIHDAARLRPFTSVADLCTRLDLAPADLEHLIQAGALDELAASRRHARWEAHFAFGRSHTNLRSKVYSYESGCA